MGEDTAKFVPFPVPTGPAAFFEAGTPVPPRRKGRPPATEKPVTARKPKDDKHAIDGKPRKPRSIKSKDDVDTSMKISATVLLAASAGLTVTESAALSELILVLTPLPKSGRGAVVAALGQLFK